GVDLAILDAEPERRGPLSYLQPRNEVVFALNDLVELALQEREHVSSSERLVLSDEGGDWLGERITLQSQHFQRGEMTKLGRQTLQLVPDQVQGARTAARSDFRRDGGDPISTDLQRTKRG